MGYSSLEHYHCIILEFLNILLMSCVQKYFFLHEKKTFLHRDADITGYQTFMSEKVFNVNLIFFLLFGKYDIHPFIHCYRSK